MMAEELRSEPHLAISKAGLIKRLCEGRIPRHKRL